MNILIPCKSKHDAISLEAELKVNMLFTYCTANGKYSKNKDKTATNEILYIYGIVDLANGDKNWADNRNRYFLLLDLDHPESIPYELNLSPKADFTQLENLIAQRK